MGWFARYLAFLLPHYQGASRVLYSLLKIRNRKEIRREMKRKLRKQKA
jgi:hypothetical protein